MKSLIRFSPTQELFQMQREVDRLFDQIRASAPSGDEASRWTPRVDLAENDEAFLMLLDLPGVDKDSVEVSFKEGMLSVRGQRKLQPVLENEQYLRVERPHGAFYRAISFPKAIEESKIEAKCLDGVLQVFVPKAEQSKPRRIEIQ